jgi:hypothetical protein
MAKVADSKDLPILLGATLMMSLVVVTMNRTLWQRLYRLCPPRATSSKRDRNPAFSLVARCLGLHNGIGEIRSQHFPGNRERYRQFPALPDGPVERTL